MNSDVALKNMVRAGPTGCPDCSGPCIDVCPTAAVLRLPDRTVVIAPMKCTGCQLCIVACPLGIIEFDPGNKIARMLEVQSM